MQHEKAKPTAQTDPTFELHSHIFEWGILVILNVVEKVLLGLKSSETLKRTS